MPLPLKPAVIAVTLCVLGCGRYKLTTDDAKTTPQTQAPAGQCPAATADACTKTRADLHDLETQRDAALKAGDQKHLAQLSLAINHDVELLQLLEAGVTDDKQLAALESKYQQLRALLDAQLNPAPTAAKGPPAAADNTTTPANGQDNTTAEPVTSPIVYQSAELRAVTKVFHDFGDLYIAETTSQVEMKASTIPWAGYWYPFSGTDLYAGDNAPLVKLDAALTKLGRNGDTATWEKDHNSTFPIDSWEGRCFAWALASATTTEPTATVAFQGVNFSPADQKALLTKISEQYPFDQYGIRYDGDAETDATFQDLRPEAFHRLVEVLLGEQHRPFVIDDDPSIQIWSKPVYRVSWTITKDAANANAYVVTANPWMTKNRDSITDDPTTVDDRSAPLYRYRLYVDPNTVKDGKYHVIAGEWIEDSISAHPDTVTVPKSDGKPLSNNQEIDANLDVVRQILGLGT